MVMEAKDDQNHALQQPILQAAPTTRDEVFPLTAVAALSIMCTAVLLLVYYLVVTRWCSEWMRLRRTPSEREEEYSSSPTRWSRGLDDSVIREIPTVQFRRETERVYGSCMVCLNEFQEQDMLRMLPRCSHTFHLRCIDIWLHGNVNCPLCRTSIYGCQVDRTITAPSSSPQESDSLFGVDDEDFVVIELRGTEDGGSGFLPRKQPQPQVPVHEFRSPKRVRTFLGDESINVREMEDDRLLVQSMRRSFSLDSANDRRLLLSVQSAVQQKNQQAAGEGCSSGNRALKSLFHLGRQGRGCRNTAILPAHFDQ